MTSELMLAAEQEIADPGTKEEGGGEEVAPFGDANEDNNHDAENDDEAGGVAGAHTCAKLAVGHDFGGVAIVVRRRDYLTVRMPAKRCIGFQDEMLLSKDRSGLEGGNWAGAGAEGRPSAERYLVRGREAGKVPAPGII
jgi:hypothetical protein